MHVSSLVLEVQLPGCSSSRQKRIRSEAIMDRLRKHFNISAALVGPDLPVDHAALGFAAVANYRREAREILEKVVEAVAAHPHAEIVRAVFDAA